MLTHMHYTDQDPGSALLKINPDPNKVADPVQNCFLTYRRARLKHPLASHALLGTSVKICLTFLFFILSCAK